MSAAWLSTATVMSLQGLAERSPTSPQRAPKAIGLTSGSLQRCSTGAPKFRRGEHADDADEPARHCHEPWLHQHDRVDACVKSAESGSKTSKISNHRHAPKV